MSSVIRAASPAPDPYTVVDDFTTSFSTDEAFWHAASSCIVPMTLISFIGVRPPAWRGVAMTPMCTTVSTPAVEITLPMIGLRMSARTKSAPPMSAVGVTTSTPMTRSIEGSSVSRRAILPPKYREAPVTRTTRATVLLRVTPLDPRALQQLAVLLLRHPLATLLDDRTHR